MLFTQREYYLIILAALLHDIGKFYQRRFLKPSFNHSTYGQECFENHFREKLGSTVFDVAITPSIGIGVVNKIKKLCKNRAKLYNL